MISRGKRPADDASVPDQPQTTPYGLGTAGHDFTLQAVMQLQGNVGQLTTKIESLSGSVDGLGAKVDDLVKWKYGIIGGAIALGAVCTFAGFLINRFADRVSFAPTAAPATVSLPLPPGTAIAPAAPAVPARR